MNSDIFALVDGAVINPGLHSIALVLGTFVLEDATTAIAALQVTDGLLPAWLALSSLYVGIAAGDIGLFALGRLASQHKWARRFLALERIAKTRSWLDGRLMTAVISTRFLPGTRLPTYTACGFLGVSFDRFALSVIVATLLWTTLLFFALLVLGVAVLEHFGPWRWPITFGIAALIFLCGRRIGRCGASALQDK